MKVSGVRVRVAGCAVCGADLNRLRPRVCLHIWIFDYEDEDDDEDD